ncbi:hypothetical protein EV175_007210, partial [Coemansia sp. RSA 1933]
MNTLEGFSSNILAGFQDRYELLELLADAIYEALFQHQGCEGAIIRKRQRANSYAAIVNRAGGSNRPTDQPSAEQPDRDPLVLRKNNEEGIIGTLLEAIRRASAAAQQILARRAAN